MAEDCATPTKNKDCPWTSEKWEDYGAWKTRVSEHGKAIAIIDAKLDSVISVAVNLNKTVVEIGESIRAMDLKLKEAIGERRSGRRGFKTYGTLTATGAGGGFLLWFITEILRFFGGG